jgi:hypothetical protein
MIVASSSNARCSWTGALGGAIARRGSVGDRIAEARRAVEVGARRECHGAVRAEDEISIGRSRVPARAT